MIRRLWLVAHTIFTEALRRREIYAIVLVTLAILLAASAVRFFDLEGLHKFYSEVALKAMSWTTILTVIVLGARQLPREFERRTIYTVIAKPVARWEFLVGKYIGVVLAGLFCLALFMLVFCLGRLLHAAPLVWPTFLEFIYLQALSVCIAAALAFLLSMLMGLDAAIVATTLIFLLGQVLTNAFTVLQEYVSAVGRGLLLALNYLVPQPALLDLSSKVVHDWPPVSLAILALATGYTVMFVAPYLAASYLLFRRRAL